MLGYINTNKHQGGTRLVLHLCSCSHPGGWEFGRSAENLANWQPFIPFDGGTMMVNKQELLEVVSFSCVWLKRGTGEGGGGQPQLSWELCLLSQKLG